MSGVKIGIGFGLWRLGMPAPETICSYAERAEEVGIDSIWLSDHIVSRQPDLDISCIMAMFAARTKKIKMGPSVLTLPARDPIQVAKTYATLDYLTGSRGRVIMAVGLGSDPRDCIACGINPDERAKRMEEGVQVMRKLWAGDNVSHEGKFYKFTDVTITPRPAKGSLDVWIGGKSDLAIKRTARYGDGWFPSFVTPDEFKDGMAKMAEYGKQYGRTVNPREAGVLIFTHLNDNRARAQETVQKFFSGFPVAAESMPARCAIGSAQECVEKVQSYVEAGCSKFVLWPIVPPEELVPQIERYGKEVIPHFS
ncbi:MAG: LLM class flavin-dependent oxidoreductase [Deltaproteobacteria bacterium]|nr:LLM class flavin-dependent oxidoreductase [Deltaproteobacteria bacterium]